MQLFSNQPNKTPVDIDFSLIVGVLFGIAVIIFAAPLLIVWVVFKAIVHTDSDLNPIENQQTQAEIDGRAAMEGWLSPDPKVAASLNAAEYYVDDDDQWR